MEIISTAWAVGLTVAFIGILGAFQVHRYLGRRDAAATFRVAINPSVFAGLRGHNLHAMLVQASPLHRTAATEFKRYLGPIDRWRFRKAWRAYHGKDEEHPNWFPRYCLPDNGPQLLEQHLEALRNAASQT